MVLFKALSEVSVKFQFLKKSVAQPRATELPQSLSSCLTGQNIHKISSVVLGIPFGSLQHRFVLANYNQDAGIFRGVFGWDCDANLVRDNQFGESVAGIFDPGIVYATSLQYQTWIKNQGHAVFIFVTHSHSGHPLAINSLF
jgi:hypothetical protein